MNREWECIIFLDEYYIYIGSSSGNFFIMQRITDLYEKGKTLTEFTQSSIQLMVQAYIVYRRKEPIVVLDYSGEKGGGMIAQRYVNQVLDSTLLLFYSLLVSAGHVSQFQQDNACAHIVKITT